MLRGVDLEVAEHEAVALIGASGSGKSTLLRCIDLLVEIDDGDVFLDGEVITDPSVDPVGVRRRLGLVFQAYNLFPHLTALENIVLGDRSAHGASRAEAEERAPAACSSASASPAASDDRPDDLSGGQQQRVAIARAFAGRPRAMLLDEVTSALDPELVGEVLEAVRDLKAEGVTMLIVTHEMSFAREVADRIGFLHDGRIIEIGPPGAGPLGARAPRDPALPAAAARGGPDLAAAVLDLALLRPSAALLVRSSLTLPSIGPRRSRPSTRPGSVRSPIGRPGPPARPAPRRPTSPSATWSRPSPAPSSSRPAGRRRSEARSGPS